MLTSQPIKSIFHRVVLQEKRIGTPNVQDLQSAFYLSFQFTFDFKKFDREKNKLVIFKSENRERTASE